MDMSNNVINVQNPIPILQQPKSKITTNILIPNEQKEIEYETVDIKEKEKLDQKKDEIKKKGIKYESFATIHNRISESILGVITDLFKKPEDEYWTEHIINIFMKDERYAYIGVFLIFIALIINLSRTYLPQTNN
jgi:predicted Holliday junction resolvase-like endonuclease